MRHNGLVAITSFLFLGFSAFSQSMGPTPPAQAAGYSLVFLDEYTNLNLSPDNTGQYPWYRGLPWEAPPKPFHASVSSSTGLGLTWTAGQQTADTTVSTCSPDGDRCRAFRYGYFEARMKWDVTTGAWPAFWMIPVQGIWGANETGELDIFEGQGDPADSRTFFGTVHDWVKINGVPTDVANNGSHNAVKLSGVNFSQWHTYGVLWVPGKVTWYFDQQPILSASTYPIFDSQDFFMLFGAQEGANWSTGNTAGVTASSLNLWVDWVKVWQLNQPQTSSSNTR